MTPRVLFRSPQQVSTVRLPTKILVKLFIIGSIFELWVIHTSSKSLLDFDEPPQPVTLEVTSLIIPYILIIEGKLVC